MSFPILGGQDVSMHIYIGPPFMLQLLQKECVPFVCFLFLELHFSSVHGHFEFARRHFTSVRGHLAPVSLHRTSIHVRLSFFRG